MEFLPRWRTSALEDPNQWMRPRAECECLFGKRYETS